MKFNQEETLKINNIISTCLLADIDSIIIENGIVRGINDDRSCVIISDENIPSFGNFKIGLNRLSVLKTRLNLLLTERENIILEAKENDKGEISQLEIQSKNAKIQFRCASTALIKAPKSINDSYIVDVQILDNEFDLISNSIKAMGAKQLMFIITENGNVNIEIKDTNNDIFKCTLQNKLENISKESFIFCYSVNIFSSVLRASLDKRIISCSLGQMGTLTTKVNGHTLIILPQIGDNQ